METVTSKRYLSPAGELILGACTDGLCLCDWADGKRRAPIYRLGAQFDFEGKSAILDHAAAELDDYFSGMRRGFSAPLRFNGTPFQQRVWTALRQIPYGSTISYAELARRIGSPRAVRAVASAIASNPLSIFVPCHRVIGSDGRLTGYAGGLDAKRRLLALETAAN